MALQPSISLQVQPASLGSLGTGFDEGLNDVNTYRKGQLGKIDLQTAQREQAGNTALRGILSQNDQSDPAYLQKVQQQMAAAGYGDVGTKYVQQAQQAGLERQKTQGELDAQKSTASGQQLTQSQEIQKQLATQAAAAARAAMAVTDPDAQKQIHDSFVDNVRALKTAHPNLDFGQFDPDQMSHEEFTDPKTLKTVSQLDYTPEQRIAAMGKEADENFKSSLPKYQQAYADALKQPDVASREAAVAAVRSQVMRDNPNAPSAKASELNSQFPTPARVPDNNNSNARLISSYGSMFKSDQDKFEKKVTPFVNLQELQKTPSWGTGAGDISLLNQLSLAEFGGYKPSDAEYNQFLKRMGVVEKGEQLMGSLENGAALAPGVRERMAKEIEAVTKTQVDKFSKTIQAHKDKISKKGIDPDEVIQLNGTYQDLNDYFKNKPTEQTNNNFSNDPTYSSIEEAMQKAPANATGAWINGVHHTFQSK